MAFGNVLRQLPTLMAGVGEQVHGDVIADDEGSLCPIELEARVLRHISTVDSVESGDRNGSPTRIDQSGQARIPHGNALNVFTFHVRADAVQSGVDRLRLAEEKAHDVE